VTKKKKKKKKKKMPFHIGGGGGRKTRKMIQRHPSKRVVIENLRLESMGGLGKAFWRESKKKFGGSLRGLTSRTRGQNRLLSNVKMKA